MARNRSRDSETEDVNQRRLRRGAIHRQHLSRWAVGKDELAPGIVGDIHLHPTTRETIREIGSGAGVGQLLVRSVVGQSFASGGDYVAPDATIYQHGFDEVVSATDVVVWPVDAVGEIQVEFAWDTYEGGGTIEIEVDGAVPTWGLIAEGSVGQVGCKRRSVHIAEGAVVRVKVTQTSGSAQTGSVLTEYSIPDPTLAVDATPTPPGPTELGPRVWYRAESISLNDGDAVAVWEDISGNGFHLQQSVAASRPILRSGVVNTKAAVEFDGSNDGMHNAEAVALPTASREWTVFAVFLTDNAAANQVIFNGDDQTNDPTKVRASQFLAITSGVLRSSIESATVESSGQSVTAATWHLGEVSRSATAAETLLDTVGNGATTVTANVEQPAGFFMGYHPATGSAYMDGKIAEVIGFDRVLTIPERDLLRDYFNTEYGV